VTGLEVAIRALGRRARRLPKSSSNGVSPRANREAKRHSFRNTDRSC